MVSIPAFSLTLTLLCVKCPDVSADFGIHQFRGNDVEGQTITRSSGSSGTPCPQNRFKCAPNATCINDKCQCDTDTHGHAQLACVQKDTFVTMVIGDPMVYLYDGTRGHISLPCRSLLTEVFSEHSMGRLGGTCRIKVHVLVHQIDHGYYVLGFDVELTITDAAKGRSATSSLRIYGYGEDGIYEYKEQGGTQQTRRMGRWGKATNIKYMDAMVSTVYDTDNNMVIVDLPECGVNARFRGHVKYTNQMPGLIVSVNQNMPVSFPQDGNPLSGSPFDTDQSSMLAKKHTLKLDRATTMLFTALEQNTDQDFGTPAISCTVSIREYKHLCQTAQQRAFALSMCGQIYTNSSITSCLNADEFGETSGSIFGACTIAICMNNQPLCSFIVNELAVFNCQNIALSTLDCSNIQNARQAMFANP